MCVCMCVCMSVCACECQCFFCAALLKRTYCMYTLGPIVVYIILRSFQFHIQCHLKTSKKKWSSLEKAIELQKSLLIILKLKIQLCYICTTGKCECPAGCLTSGPHPVSLSSYPLHECTPETGLCLTAADTRKGGKEREKGEGK